tara:strand:+ start:3260 stop:3586 length:327 start_codon:yes stop_codon:yes gene_type:complete
VVRNEDVNGLDKGVSSFVFSFIASPLQEYKNKKVINRAGFINFIWIIIWFGLVFTKKNEKQGILLGLLFPIQNSENESIKKLLKSKNQVIINKQSHLEDGFEKFVVEG